MTNTPIAAKLAEALSFLLQDVEGYPAWDRPCAAVNNAREALAEYDTAKDSPAMERDEVVGHKTFHTSGGGFRHEPLLRSEADVILQRCEEEKRQRHELMPDEQSAIRMFFQAWQRLKELGWKEAMYCPKDRTEFEVIEAGSTGIHRCHYDGEWPKGTYWILEDGDMMPSHPVLYRMPQPPHAAPEEG